MFEEFLYDLRSARRISGLSQKDCGHLTGTSLHQISNIERGVRLPTLQETLALSVLYGRNFESLFGPLMRDVRKSILQKIETLPHSEADDMRRHRTIERLSERLLIDSQSEYET
jgi:transcriptional regulator with XRE-family HTH domain